MGNNKSNNNVAVKQVNNRVNFREGKVYQVQWKQICE